MNTMHEPDISGRCKNESFSPPRLWVQVSGSDDCLKYGKWQQAPAAAVAGAWAHQVQLETTGSEPHNNHTNLHNSRVTLIHLRDGWSPPTSSNLQS